MARRFQELTRLPDDHRIVQYSGRWTSVAQLRLLADALDRNLTRAGLGAGTGIGLVTRNRPPHIAAILGILATRRCLVPISSIQADRLVVDDVDRLGVQAVLADQEDWDRHGLVTGCASAGALGLVLTGDPSDPIAVVGGCEKGARSPSDLDGIAILMPTSGTTGPPKRVPYSYANINGALGRIAGYAAATRRSLTGPLRSQEGVVIATLALAHIGGLWAVLQALAEGRSIALMDRFEPLRWADLVEEHGARMASLPPATIQMLLDSTVGNGQLASLRAVTCGTAPLDPDIADRFTDRFGIPVLTAYGATEFPGGLVGWTLQDYRAHHRDKRGSVGRARPGISVRIVDPATNRVLGTDESGLISVLSPQATTPTEDGWVRTSDIGRLDSDGFLWILGRADDAINRGGFKILPPVVEAALRSHPSVLDAAVTGIEDARLGEVPVAAVVLSHDVTAEELSAWCRDHLARYQVPTTILIVDDLPRTPSLKISKEEVRAFFR